MSATHGDHETEEKLDQDQSASRELLILYATETGTAQETADRIARECRRVRFHSRVQGMDAYPPVSSFLNESNIVLRFIAGSIDFGAPGHLRDFDHWLGH
jgi:sulfite reductase alpha subunit-like flavoprotein